MRADVASGDLTAATALWRRLRRERATAATLVLAVATPVAAARYLDHRIHDRLEPALTRALGVDAHVGGFEAGLTGNVTVAGLRIGDLLTADAVEAAVSLDSLLAGELTPDEIRVTRPRLRAVADRDGREAWRQVLARLAARRGHGGTGGAGRRLRRIVVSGGDLVADVRGVRVRAGDVELHPSGHGVRVVTGAVTLAAAGAGWRLDGAVTRVGADVRLPELAVERAALVGGTATFDLGGPRMALRDLTAVGDGGGAWRLTGTIDDAGAPRPFAAALASDAGGRRLAIAGERVPLAVLAPVSGALVLRDARASGQVALALDRGLWLRGALELAGARLDHRAVADAAVELDGTIAVAAHRTGDRLELEQLTLRRGAATTEVAGWLRWGAHGPTAGALDVALPDTRCRDLLDAIPPALRGHLDAMVVRGQIGGHAHATIDLDAELGDGVHLALGLDNRCEVVADPPEVDPRRLAGVVEHRFPDGSRAAVGPGLGDWVTLAALPAHVRGALVAAEDARFWDHAGFDLAQIARSLEIDLREDRLARGGSTISQQLVKNAFLHQRRTLARKLEEAVLTWRLEAVLPKTTILERYLNVIELGPGVYGLAAAARHWFGCAPAQLTVRQMAFLAALTPAPRTISARLAAGHKLDPDTAQRIEVVLRAMRRAGVIDAATAHAAAGAPLDFRPAALGR
ncbi:MAG: transglycosylase domain-containing protein [Myxococcales bacterium]|nr:transglycosylase domain-containing protein [Myxococcales bacterium]MBK7196606.1 transglycosylase domain-containing protein [Myxococcales bacterium]MBP6845569.1 transglycosylase domain-containing protein [Kofleriaceae bacterium]